MGLRRFDHPWEPADIPLSAVTAAAHSQMHPCFSILPSYDATFAAASTCFALAATFIYSTVLPLERGGYPLFLLSTAARGGSLTQQNLAKSG